MSSCDPFSANFQGSAEVLFNKLKKMAKEYSGEIQGDASAGSFSLTVPLVGEVKGDYSVSGQTATITITDKPFLLPCGTIIDQVKSFL